MQKALFQRATTLHRYFPPRQPMLILPGCHIAYMPDRDGARAYDFSGRGNHGSYSNIKWTSYGRFGPSRYFSDYGSKSYVQIGKIHFDYVSVSAWIRPAVLTYTYHRGIIGNFDGTDRDFAMFIYGGENTLRVRVDTSGGYTIVDTTAFIAAKKWHHFLFTYDGVNIKVYRNGELQKSEPHAAGGPIKNTGNTMFVGVMGIYDENYSLYGEMDEIQVYARALTTDEVKLLYDVGKVRY